MSVAEAIFIGGRSGAGKSTVAFALHELLSERGVRHAAIEGDFLDLAYPAPWEHSLAERNLAAVWANYRELGYRRLIYTNTVSILELPALTNAMGEPVNATPVLLRAENETVASRLGVREHGAGLQRHLERSAAAAVALDAAPVKTHRIDTDGKTPLAVAEQILAIARWDG